MKCPSCNTENPSDSRFCLNCGAPLADENKVTETNAEVPKIIVGTAPQYTQAPQSVPYTAKKSKTPLIIGVCAAVLAVVVLIVVVLAVFSGGELPDYEKHIYSFYLPEEDETVFLYDGKLLDDKLDGGMRLIRDSDNGKHAVAADDYSTLYYIDSKGLKAIAEDVEYFNISDSGKTAVFIDSDDILYIAKLPSGKPRRVAEDVVDFDIWYDASITYTTADGELYFFNTRRSVSLGDGYECVGASENGRYIYVKNSNGSLYLTSGNGKDREKLSSSVSQSFCYNRDMTEIMFVSEGKLYISKKGGERIKLCNAYQISLLDGDYKNDAYVSGSDKLVGQPIDVYDGDETDIYIMTRKHDMIRIANNISYAYTSGDHIYYKKNGGIYRVKGSPSAEPKKLASDVSIWSLSDKDGKVYYIDQNDTLYYISGSKAPQKVADDVYIFSNYGDMLFYLEEYTRFGSTLYRCKDGKSAKHIADDVDMIFATSEYVMYTVVNEDIVGTNDYDGRRTYDVYVSSNGKTFKRILEGAQ